jgi:hypothetical protein
MVLVAFPSKFQRKDGPSRAGHKEQRRKGKVKDEVE